MRHHRAFLGKAFDMGGFFFKIADRDEQRKIGVLVAGGLELRIKLVLDVFPETVAPRLDDHAAAHVGGFRHVGGAHDLLIPFGKILVAAGCDGSFGGGRCVTHDEKRESVDYTDLHGFRKRFSLFHPQTRQFGSDWKVVFLMEIKNEIITLAQKLFPFIKFM